MKYKLRIQLVLINVSIAVVPLILVGYIAHNIHLDYIKNNISNSVNVLFSQVNSRITEYFDEMNAISKSVFLNRSLQALHRAEETNWVKYTWIQDHFNSYMEMNSSIRGVYWRDGEGKVYTSSSLAIQQEIEAVLAKQDQATLESGEMLLSGPLEQHGGVAKDYFAIRTIKSVIPNEYMKPQGIGVLVLDRARLSNMIRDSQLEGATLLYVLNENNEAVVAAHSQQPGQQLQFSVDSGMDGTFISINGNNHLVRVSAVNKVGWKLVAAISTDKLFAEADVLKYYVAGIVILIFIVVIILTLLFNMSLTRPINALIDAFSQVAAGNLQSKVAINDRNEISRMAVHFNRMVKEIGELTTRESEIQQELFEAELQKKHFELIGLQSQINAHFLYNTLNSLRGMVRSGSGKQADAMIVNLVEYFRYCSRQEASVRLGEELAYLSIYFDIQKLRFAKRLQLEVDVNPELQSYPVLKLLIQPLVENAVFYGLERKAGPGRIRIRARACATTLEIIILDNGKGMMPAKLAQIKSALVPDALQADSAGEDDRGNEADKRSIGIVNIHKRIQLNYGSAYGVDIKSWPNMGTAITLKLPYAKDDAIV